MIINEVGAGEMDQHLNALAALPEELSSFTSTHTVTSTICHSSRWGTQGPFLAFMGTRHAHVHGHSCCR